MQTEEVLTNMYTIKNVWPLLIGQWIDTTSAQWRSRMGGGEGHN